MLTSNGVYFYWAILISEILKKYMPGMRYALLSFSPFLIFLSSDWILVEQKNLPRSHSSRPLFQS